MTANATVTVALLLIMMVLYLVSCSVGSTVINRNKLRPSNFASQPCFAWQWQFQVWMFDVTSFAVAFVLRD